MKHLNEINMIRAFACLSVVYNHVLTNYAKFAETDFTGTPLFLAIRYLFLFATPVFILISITLLSRSYPDKLPKGFLWKRVQYILLPYILIGLLSAYISAAQSGAAFLATAWNIVGLGDWHGFFILVIFQFYLLYYLLNRSLRKVNPFAALAAAFALSFAHLYALEHLESYRLFIFKEYPLWYRTFILAWLSYFVAGFYIGVHYEQIFAFLANKIWLPLLAAMVSFGWIYYNVSATDYTLVSSDRYDMFFYTLSMYFLVTVLFRKLKKPRPLLEIVSSFSFFIYLSHMLFILALGRIVKVFEDRFLLYTGSLLLFTIGICVGVGALLYLYRWTQWITGRNRLMDRLLAKFE